MGSMELEPLFNDRYTRVKISPEEEEIGGKTFDLFEEKWKRSLAWNIKNGVVTIPKKDFETEDIIIDGLNTEEISEQLARLFSGFKMVEDFLPDYMAVGSRFTRTNRGLFRWNLQWGKEEEQHGLALGSILEQTGHKTRDQINKEYYENLTRVWESPFSTTRQIVAHAVFQEWYTHLAYDALTERAKKEGAPKIARILNCISKDETYHYAGYRDIITQIYHKADPEGTIDDVLYVGREFRMPGEILHPDSRQWIKDLREIGLLGTKETGLSGRKFVAKKIVYDTLSAFSFVPESVARKTANEFLGKKSLN